MCRDDVFCFNRRLHLKAVHSQHHEELRHCSTLPQRSSTILISVVRMLQVAALVMMAPTRVTQALRVVSLSNNVSTGTEAGTCVFAAALGASQERGCPRLH